MTAPRRPRIGVLGYGSILHPDALDELLGEWENRTTPVRVDGFRRVFNQRASWRETDGNEQAVLSVERDERAWCNAVLIQQLSREEYQRYRQRERGYRLVAVDTDSLTPYDPPLDTEIEIVLTAVGQHHDDTIEPIPDYVDSCIEGAAHWGQQFLTDFLETTTTNRGETLQTAHRESIAAESKPGDGNQSSE